MFAQGINATQLLHSGTHVMICAQINYTFAVKIIIFFFSLLVYLHSHHCALALLPQIHFQSFGAKNIHRAIEERSVVPVIYGRPKPKIL